MLIFTLLLLLILLLLFYTSGLIFYDLKNKDNEMCRFSLFFLLTCYLFLCNRFFLYPEKNFDFTHFLLQGKLLYWILSGFFMSFVCFSVRNFLSWTCGDTFYTNDFFDKYSWTFFPMTYALSLTVFIFINYKNPQISWFLSSWKVRKCHLIFKSVVTFSL